MDDRFNTIAGWVLFAGIVALGSSIVASEMFHSERPGKDGLSDRGRRRRKAKAARRPSSRSSSISPTPTRPRAQQVFKKCAACHNADKGGANQLGPNLWGVLGEPIGQGKGFAFSDALAKKGGTWDWDNLGAWLTSPKAFAPGTKMTFAGLSNPQDRANVIAFLNQHSDAPKPLPAAPRCGRGCQPGEGADGEPGGRTMAGSRRSKEPALNASGAASAEDQRRRRRAPRKKP